MRLYRAQHPMTCCAQIVLLCCIHQRHGDRMLRCTVAITQRIQRVNPITFNSLQSSMLLSTNGKCLWHPVNLAALQCVSICSTSGVIVDHFTLECISIQTCSNHVPVWIHWLDIFALFQHWNTVDKFHREGGEENGGESAQTCRMRSQCICYILLKMQWILINTMKVKVFYPWLLLSSGTQHLCTHSVNDFAFPSCMPIFLQNLFNGNIMRLFKYR